MRFSPTIIVLLLLASVALGADADRTPARQTQALPPGASPDALKVTEAVVDAEPTATAAPASETRAQSIVLDVYSINSGGSQEVQAGNLRMGVSVAQPVAGVTSAGPLRLELGYWYMVTDQPDYVCPVTLTGDVNLSGDVLTSDIIYLVNFVLKAGAEPQPCVGAGDVNCDGQVVTSDIIYLVNYVLRAMAPPCDVCTLMPATWPCP